MTTNDRITLLVAAMLTGQSAPGDKLIAQVLMIAKVIEKKITEETHGDNVR